MRTFCIILREAARCAVTIIASVVFIGVCIGAATWILLGIGNAVF